MTRVQARKKKKTGTSRKMQGKHVVEPNVNTSLGAKMTGLAGEETAGAVKKDTVKELQDLQDTQGMLQLFFETLKVIIISNITVDLTNAIRIRIEAKALLLPLPLRLLYHLLFQVIPALAIPVYSICSLGPKFKKEWNRNEEPCYSPVNKCAEGKIDIPPKVNKGLAEDETIGSIDARTKITALETEELVISFSSAWLLTVLAQKLLLWRDPNLVNSIIPQVLQIILIIVFGALYISGVGYGPDLKKWWAGLEKFWCPIFNAFGAEKETIEPVETSRGQLVRIFHDHSIKFIIHTLVVVYVVLFSENIFGGDLTLLAGLQQRVHPIVFWSKMLPAFYHLYCVAIILTLCIKNSLAFDTKFPFPKDNVLQLNFRRKIDLSENIWYGAYVQACFWLFVRPDSLETGRHLNEDEKMTAFTDHISRVVWNAERGIRWKLLCFFWSALLLTCVFLIDIKLTIITFFSKESAVLFINGIETEIEESLPFGYRTAVVALKVSAWLLGLYVAIILAAFLGIWLGSLKLACIINRDIQSMKEKFGEKAGLQMARMWRNQFRNVHPWAVSASDAYWWLTESATMLSDKLKAGIEKVVDPFFPADEEVAVEA